MRPRAAIPEGLRWLSVAPETHLAILSQVDLFWAPP